MGVQPKYTIAHVHSQDSIIVKLTGWRALALVVAVGLTLRLLVMWAIWANGGSPLIGDEGNYVLSALPLSEGRGIPDLWLWIRAPGVIFFAAAVFAVTGGSLWALNLAQIALAGVTQVLAFFLGTFTTQDPATARRAGLWAAALVALNPFLILSDNFFLSEPLYILLVLGLVLCLLAHARDARAVGSRQRAEGSRRGPLAALCLLPSAFCPGHGWWRRG